MNKQGKVSSKLFHLGKATKLSLSASLGLGLLAISLLTLLLFSLGRPQVVLASHPAGLEINLRGTSLFFMDSNAFCSTSANQQGPDGLWLPVVVTNTTLTETYTGLQMTFSPSISTTADDPVRYLGNLGPGESISVFYFVDYRELRDHPSCSNGIDGWFSEPYTLTITSVDNSLTGPASFTDTFDSVSMISANAGGLLISDTIGPGAAVGQVLTQTAVYKFGNNPTGSQLFLQPAGNGDFNDECFRLVGSEILTSDVTGVPVGVEDVLFFPNTDTANPDEISVQYEWLVLCSPGVETQTFPWAEITSGTQFKYNGQGYGAATNPLPNPVTDVVGVNKSVSPPILSTGGTVTYTVEFANSYTQTVYLLQITDTLDPGIEYMGMVLNVSDILPSNSTISPTIPATGTLRWYSIPFPNNTASYAIPPSGSIFLVYTATVTNTLGLYDNTVLGVIGQEIVGPATATVRVGLPPNLSVTKIATTPKPLQPGDTITYSIVISNSGGDAFGVTVSDTIPLYTSFVPGSVTISPPSAGGTPGLPPIIASDITVAGNSLVTVTYRVVVDNPLPAGAEIVVNTAAITSTEVPTPTTTTVTNTVVAAPDLQITKDDGGVTTTPGGVVIYTLSYANAGNQDATGVIITDIVPANTTFNASASDPGWSCVDGDPPGTVCTLNIGSLPAGANGSLAFAVTIDDPLPAGADEIFNAATIADDGKNGPDPNPADNTDSDTTAVVAAPDLQITKDDGGVGTTPGGVVIYTLVYTNTGGQGASGVIISEAVPANTTFNAPASTAGWSCADGSPAGTLCTFTISSLPAGASGAVNFALNAVNPFPAGASTIANTVAIADDGTNGPDPTPTNNTDTDTTPVVSAPDLQIAKDDGGITSAPGGVVVYTITYANAGDQNATGVVISDTVPANTTFNAPASTAGWSCADGAPAGTLCTFNVGSLASGTNGAVNFALTVANPFPTGANTLTNTVTIADDGTNGTDPNANNNTDTDTTPVAAAPNLQISKDDGGVTATPGGVVVYTLTYTNSGNQDAANVIISDTVPANTAFNAPASSPGWNCADGAPAGTLCTINVGNVAAGTSGSINFAITVANPFPLGLNMITNTALIANDSDTDTTPVNIPAVAITVRKSVDRDRLAFNQAVTYTLVVTNTGLSSLNPVVVTDTLPSGLAYIPGSATPPPSTVNGQILVWSNVATGQGLLPNQSVQITLRASVAATSGTHINLVETQGTGPTGQTVIDNDNIPVFVADPRIALSKEIVPPGVVNGMVTYTLHLTNTGPVTLGVVPLVDHFTGPVNYVGGTPPADTVDNQIGRITWNDLTTSFGDMVPGQVFLVDTVFTLTTSVNNAFTITNVATVSNVLDVFNNPANEDNDQASLVNTPTAVDLLYFQAGQQGQYVLLSWATAVEFDNFGFRLLRSPTGDLADAVEIAFIPGQGHGQNSGAYYTYLDKSVYGGETYSYWLVDVDFFGLETVHGPETIIPTSTAGGGDFTLFLPLIVK